MMHRVQLRPASLLKSALKLVLLALFPALAFAAATVTGVSATTGRYGLSQNLSITVTFNEAVNVVGAPELALNATGSPVAICATASNSVTMTCTYTIAAGQTAATLDYTATTALTLPLGSTITTVSDSNAATLTLATPGAAGSLATSNVVIDTTAPTLPAANIAVNNSARPNTIALTFSEDMTNNAALTTASNYTVSNNSSSVTYSIASAARTSATVVTLTLATANPANTATYITNADITGHIKVTLASGLTDLAGNALAATTVTEAGATATTDSTAPTLPAAGIRAVNSSQPHTVVLTFIEPLAATAAVTDTSKYILTNNAGSITYTLASASQASAGVVTLTLATADPASTASYLTNSDITGHLKVALASGFTDLAGNTLAATTITEASASPAPSTDTTRPTLSSTLALVDATHVRLSFNEKLTKTQAETASNYTLTGTGAISAITGAPSAAVLASNGLDVTLTVPSLAAMATGNTLTVAANTNLRDLAGNTMLSSANAVFTATNSPSSLAFDAVTNALLNTKVESNAVTIIGLSLSATVSVISGSDATLQCAIAPAATGTFPAFSTCAPGTPLSVSNGDQIKVQLTSATTANTAVSGGIRIGGVDANFSVTTAPLAPVPSGITVASLTNLAAAFATPDPAITLSANGVAIIPSSVTGQIAVKPSVPANSGLLVKNGGTAQFLFGGISVSVKPVNSDVLLVTKSYTIDTIPSNPLFEIATGEATLSYSGIPAAVASVQLGLGSTAKQLLLTSTSTSALNVTIRKNQDGTALLAVSSGRMTTRLASGASTIATSDVASTVYKNEVATMNVLGQFTNLRIGSLTGTQTGIVGDAMALSLPVNTTSRGKVPYLGQPSERADPNKNLMVALFDFIGSRTTMSQNIQGGFGQLPLILDNAPLHVMPYGDVLVDPSRPDGITLADDGHFEVSRNGVYVKVSRTISNLSQFSQAIQTAYNGTVVLTEDASLEVNNGGRTVLMKPNLVTTPNGSTSVGLDQLPDGVLIFRTPGADQLLFPHFFNLSQLAVTFKDLDPAMTLIDNLNGTVTAKLAGTSYLLIPSYEVLSPIGGIPPEHRNDPWWNGPDGLIYFKYPTGGAQGFRIQ
ncbi:beta strand repeat-containing protein [Chitinimonas sp. JJ19]|uniref:beta strand repeat-containing protein n=1 Tax=Chitinimonas sp. JJ19 TaxID=3109352 RepID=UPI003002C216